MTENKEFNLSEKIEDIRYQNGMLPTEAVKQAVKLLKEDFLEDWTNANGKIFTLDEIRNKIDKRFGDKLI
jgi:hypothetical protein